MLMGSLNVTMGIFCTLAFVADSTVEEIVAAGDVDGEVAAGVEVCVTANVTACLFASSL